jgi:hypothetical protein
MRTVPPDVISNELSRFDLMLKQALEKLLLHNLDGNSWLQATLSVKKGGLGLKSALSNSHAAYIASITSAAHLIQNTLKWEIDILDQSHLSQYIDGYTTQESEPRTSFQTPFIHGANVTFP